MISKKQEYTEIGDKTLLTEQNQSEDQDPPQKSESQILREKEVYELKMWGIVPDFT